MQYNTLIYLATSIHQHLRLPSHSQSDAVLLLPLLALGALQWLKLPQRTNSPCFTLNAFIWSLTLWRAGPLSTPWIHSIDMTREGVVIFHLQLGDVHRNLTGFVQKHRTWDDFLNRFKYLKHFTSQNKGTKSLEYWTTIINPLALFTCRGGSPWGQNRRFKHPNTMANSCKSEMASENHQFHKLFCQAGPSGLMQQLKTFRSRFLHALSSHASCNEQGSGSSISLAVPTRTSMGGPTSMCGVIWE